MTTRHVDYSASVTVPRPVDAIAAFFTDPANAPKWGPPATSLDIRPPGLLSAGSVLDATLAQEGGTYRRSWAVVKFEATEGVLLRSRFEDDKRPEWMAVHDEIEYQWASEARSETTLSLRWRLRADGWGQLVAAHTVGVAYRFGPSRRLRYLKKTLEATETPT